MSKSAKKYRIKMDWIANLDSMHEKLWCIGDDLDEGRLIGPITILGKQYSASYELQPLIDECDELAWAAKRGLVTGSQFGRIKTLVTWRVEQRYFTCLAHGPESEAALCFNDL